MLINNWADL